MTYDQFNSLDNHEQLAAVWAAASFICDRCYSNEKFLLYHLNDFYVEICYASNDNEIIGVRAFKHPPLLSAN